MSSRNKRRGGTSDEQIEDAVVVSETSADETEAGAQGEDRTPRDPGESPMIAPEDAPADPNPGDGSSFYDRGDVAVDKRADALAETGAGLDSTEATPETAADAGLASAAAPATPPDLETPPEPAAARQETAHMPPPPPPSASPQPQKSGGGFWGAALGGIVAAGVGYGAAVYLNQEPPETGPDPVLEALAPLQQGLADIESQQQEQLGGLGGRLSELDTRLSDIAASVAERDTAAVESRLEEVSTELAGTLDALSGRFESVTSGIGGLEETLAGVQDRLAVVNDRLTAVEQRPLTESSETARTAFQQYEDQLSQLREDLSAQLSRNEELTAELQAAQEAAQSQIQTVQSQASDIQAEAERVAERAATREAVARIEGALERGAPFADALAQLPDSVVVPEALSANAENGVSSLPDLRLSLPDTAREALDASIRETVSDDPTERVLAFLRSQTGARSLAPKDGEDPDAVLSRAEALVADGDLAGAIAELQLLPPTGQAAVSDWVSRAESRMAVTAALAELASTLTTDE